MHENIVPFLYNPNYHHFINSCLLRIIDIVFEKYTKWVTDVPIKLWRKFAGGEIHFSAIGRNLFKPLYRLLKIKKKVPASGKKSINRLHKPDEKPFGKFQGQLLLIHGEKDPETKLALQQI
jgi:hypothetical protein